jgi:hypothetical protein
MFFFLIIKLLKYTKWKKGKQTENAVFNRIPLVSRTGEDPFFAGDQHVLFSKRKDVYFISHSDKMNLKHKSSDNQVTKTYEQEVGLSMNLLNIFTSSIYLIGSFKYSK